MCAVHQFAELSNLITVDLFLFNEAGVAFLYLSFIKWIMINANFNVMENLSEASI